MKRCAWLALAMCCLAGIADAQALHPISPKGLPWRLTPSGNDIARYYPPAAERANLGGWTVVECLTQPTGKLDACKVLGEGPTGAGFGEAGLKLTRLFQLDLAKISPETLAGGVLAMPIILNIPGSPTPPRNDLAGEPSLVLTPAKGGKFPCPVADATDQTCNAHRFTWATRPGIAETAPFVRAAAATPASSSMICVIGDDQRLTGCQPYGPAAPAQAEAMTALAPLFALPSRADDKASTKGGFALIQFDWPALKHAVETSVLTKAP